MPLVMGRDHLGNKYYEIIKDGTSSHSCGEFDSWVGRLRRWVKMAGVRSHIDYDPEKIPGIPTLINC